MSSPLPMSDSTTAEFFGFSRRPFRGTPSAEDFVDIPAFDHELERLWIAVTQGDGVGVLTAAPGAGKTILCEHLVERLQDRFAAALLSSSGFATRRALLQAMLFALGQSYGSFSEQELRLGMLNFARQAVADKDGVVLIVDEAHLLNARQLEELRCLTNHSEAGQPLIRVLLSGQLPLEEALVSPELEALNYRITCHATLDPLSLEESARLIDGRLRNVGSTVEDVFTGEALETICRVSDGNPRCLVQLCDHSLALSAGRHEAPVAVQTVREALHELKQLPLQWNESAVDQRGNETSSNTQNPPNDAADVPAADGSGFRPSETDSADGATTWSTPAAAVELGATVDAGETSGWSSFEPGRVSDDDVTSVPAERLDATAPDPAVEETVSASNTDGFVEIPVADIYAALDSTAGIAQPEADLHDADGGLADRSVDTCDTSRSKDLVEVPAVAEKDPVQQIDDVIATLSELTDACSAERHPNPYQQPEEWRSSGDARRYDVVNPASLIAESNDAAGPAEFASLEPTTPPRVAVEAAAQSERHVAVDTASSPRRPYARLFSRVRRQQVGSSRDSS